MGQTVHRFKQYFPDAQIEAFEPVSETFEALRSYTGAYRDVRCHLAALGETERTTQISLAPDSCLNSLANEASEIEAGGDFEEVVIWTLDRFCEKEKITHIDLLKTDTEGFDLDVLRGGDYMLDQECVDFILVEVNFHPSGAGQTSFCPVNSYLQAKGYRVAGVYDLEYEAGVNPAVNYCNVLYAREGIFDRR